jgi:hypothetical protein
MSSSELTPTPSPAPLVPPRSALRKPSQTQLNSASTSTRPSISERDSSLYVLEVGAPRVQTPSLSSGSESEEVEVSRVAPNMARRSIFEENVFGKKRVGTDRDPHKVRDGLGPKESPSGVYTRTSFSIAPFRSITDKSAPTFPGACGPRPAQYPSHVYTPTNFQLYPGPSSAGPSRSASSSSSNEDLPQTPISPTLRTFSNKTMAGLRRISGSLASFDPRSSPTPASNRDSYFSYTSTSSRQSSILVSPNSINFPAGLGVGLAEKDGITGPKIESSLMTRRATEEIKIKRKPVPSAEIGDDSDELANGIKRVSIAHAM